MFKMRFESKRYPQELFALCPEVSNRLGKAAVRVHRSAYFLRLINQSVDFGLLRSALRFDSENYDRQKTAWTVFNLFQTNSDHQTVLCAWFAKIQQIGFQNQLIWDISEIQRTGPQYQM